MKNDKLFEILHEENIGSTKNVTVIRDNSTNVMYMFVSNMAPHSGGLTPLIDKDGKPIIKESK